MMNSIDVIEKFKTVKSNRKQLFADFPWLNYLANTKQKNINLENVRSISHMGSNPVLDYVIRTLKELKVSEIREDLTDIVETVLVWSEVAKCGTLNQRNKWEKTGFNLEVHNLGSAEIFYSHHDKSLTKNRIIYTLIKTHGLIGQYIRGEVDLKENILLTQLVTSNQISKSDLLEILFVLNKCILSGVSKQLWNELSNEVLEIIHSILDNNYPVQNENSLFERLKKLRSQSIKNGEDFSYEYHRIFSNDAIKLTVSGILDNCSLWYVEPALYDFTFEEFVKVILLCSDVENVDDSKHLDFQPLMNELYYDHEGIKKINLFKKRIFEKYLSEMSFEDILAKRFVKNLHVKHVLTHKKHAVNTFIFNFEFSVVTSKLIEFCVEAEKAEENLEKAILLLYDYFGLRHDQFDRFHNEKSYLATMNQTIDLKKVILDYIVGDEVIDIGPGGGALLDEIVKRYPDSNAVGIDFSKNVVDALQKRKQLEGLKWNVLYGNALDLEQYVDGTVDTIIFCSIIHELFSYIEWNGQKFNYDVIKTALQSAFKILSKGGRIIIRDGIMTEPKDEKRIIRFKSSDGIDFLKRYASDFKGRNIEFEVIGQNEVLMPVNDAMEMLYTYTWGENSYAHEVQEQFGYFTPSEYVQFIKESLGEEAKVVVVKHYLQEGYTIALSPKIDIFDTERNPVPLPDSTSLIVIEKA